eukprot:m.83716 g.83716  ORF g.83716 m.83716 type:complete len:60 (+) comp12726_c0_seq8:1456-1635(+)
MILDDWCSVHQRVCLVAHDGSTGYSEFIGNNNIGINIKVANAQETSCQFVVENQTKQQN